MTAPKDIAAHTKLAAQALRWNERLQDHWFMLSTSTEKELCDLLQQLASALSQPSAQPDCAGGSPCTDCHDKKQCQRGCRKQAEFISQEHRDRTGWKAECDAADALLRGLGLDPLRCRTEGGALNTGRALSLLKDLPERVALTDEQIEKLRDATFSINNPFCPVDSKSMRKAIRGYEALRGIGTSATKEGM